MCFILSAIKLKESEEVKNAILKVLSDKQNDNSDGSGSLCYADKVVIQRDMYLSQAEMKNSLDNSMIANFHFRTATVGEKSLKNVHFWKIGQWAFCHNGTIQNMGKGDKSDSLVFFENLIKKRYLTDSGKVQGAKIKAYVNKCDYFWGRFLIINLQTKNIYFFGDFELYLLNKSYLVFTSATAEFENEMNIMGLSFPVENEIEKLDSKIEGVWMFDYAKQSFSQIFEKLKEFTNTTHYHQGADITNDYMDEWIWDKDKKDYVENPALKKNNKVEIHKSRTNESYKKEFYGRLEGELENNLTLEEIMLEEYETKLFNSMGRSDTEETYWQLWIAPQQEANGDKDFPLREVKENLPGKLIKMDEAMGFKSIK